MKNFILVSAAILLGGIASAQPAEPAPEPLPALVPEPAPAATKGPLPAPAEAEATAPPAAAPESAPVAAPPEAAAPALTALPSIEISLKGGGHFPQLMNKLGTSFDGILKVGYAPFADRRVQLFVDLGYSQPAQELASSDPRLAGSEYHSTLVMRDLATTVGAQYFILPPSESLVPYAGVGLRVHFLRAEVIGGSSEAFGENTETDTRFGGVLFGGAGLHLGPGILLGELVMGYAPVGQRVTGSANIGALSVLVGYGLLF